MRKQKNEHHHPIVHIQITISTKFQLKLTNRVFESNFPKKHISGRKQK